MFDDPNKEEAETLLEEAKRLLAFYEKHRSSLESRGVNVEKVLREAKSDLEALEKACREVDDAQEVLLQNVADLADAELEAFKLSSSLIDELLKKHPDDPRVQELVKLREQEKKKFPKDS